MRYKKSSEEILPDKGMILQFINGKDISDEVIEFYDKYIIKISELMIIDSEYNFPCTETRNGSYNRGC